MLCGVWALRASTVDVAVLAQLLATDLFCACYGGNANLQPFRTQWFKMLKPSGTGTSTTSAVGVVSQVPSYLPLALIDKCIGSRLWIIMKSDKELVGYYLLRSSWSSVTFVLGSLGEST